MTFRIGNRLMLHAFGNNIQLTLIQRHHTIAQMDIQFASYDQEYFIRFGMVMPDELSLNFCQFEMIIIHLCNDLRGPMLGNFCQFFLKVNG